MALLSSLAAAAPAVHAAEPLLGVPPAPPVARFPMEGGGHATVCGTQLLTAADGPGAELLRAQVREVSSTLDIPGREWYGPGKWMNDTSLGPWRGGLSQTIELPAPQRVNRSCVTVYGGAVDAAGPGLLYVSSTNGTTWGPGARAEWFESVAVAFNLRPYIAEQERDGALLVWADSSTGPIAAIQMELPFCVPARKQKWAAAGPQASLKFSFDGMPETVNQVKHPRYATSPSLILPHADF